ncbi:MAG: PilZ domain-containing protein [Myxococcaceae bacterium]
MASDDSGEKERRKETRIPARFEVRFTDPVDAAKAFRVYSLNVSAGGLCLRPSKKYNVGEPVQLAMTVAGAEFNLEAVVAWEREGVIGVRFENVKEEDRAKLEYFIEELASSRKPRAD